MEYDVFTEELVEELKQLPPPDKERIIQSLNTAIADEETKVIIPLRNFRDGKHLCVFNSEYMDLYDVFK